MVFTTFAQVLYWTQRVVRVSTSDTVMFHALLFVHLVLAAKCEQVSC